MHTDLARAWWLLGKPEPTTRELLAAMRLSPVEVRDRPAIRAIVTGRTSRPAQPSGLTPKPSAVTETDSNNEVRKRPLALLASLARTVLGRDLKPMKHTALDVALDQVVAHTDAQRSLPLLGQVAYVLGSPTHLVAALPDQAGHLTHCGTGPHARPAPLGPRRPVRPVRRTFERHL